MKKLICLLLTGLMLLSIAACSAKPDTPTENDTPTETNTPPENDTPTETDTPENGGAEITEPSADEEDGQNPVMNFIGDYYSGRASLLVEADGMENAKFTVRWSSSAWETAIWEMSGRLDPDTLTAAYEDGRKTVSVYKDDGTVETETVEYENGKGAFTFNGEDYTLTWQDDEEHIADGMVFVSAYAEDEDSDYYAVATSFDKVIVEAFASDIRFAVLEKDWETLSHMMSYPVTVMGTEIADADAFIAHMNAKGLDQDALDAFEKETCTDLFANSYGISMADGQVGFAERAVDGVPMLQIISFM